MRSAKQEEIQKYETNLVDMILHQYHRGMLDATTGQISVPRNEGKHAEEAYLKGVKEGRQCRQIAEQLAAEKKQK